MLKLFTGPMYTLALNLTVISYVYRCFIPNQTTFNKHCLTQWVSKLPWVKQYLVNFTGLVSITNASVHKTQPFYHWYIIAPVSVKHTKKADNTIATKKKKSKTACLLHGLQIWVVFARYAQDVVAGNSPVAPFVNMDWLDFQRGFRPL